MDCSCNPKVGWHTSIKPIRELPGGLIGGFVSVCYGSAIFAHHGHNVSIDEFCILAIL
jgi:hypothetical protein